MAWSHHPRALTLVETLVVIGVIGLLIGLLVPAMASVRAASRSLRCQSNLKQMAMASQSYATLYDAWPAAIRYEVVNGQHRRVAWDWVTAGGNQLISPGAIWAFMTNPDDVQQCPDFHGSATFGGDPYTGYNYNTSYIGGEAPSPYLIGWTYVRKGVPPHGCRRACECAMYGDGGWKSGANKFMRAPLNPEQLDPSTPYAGGQAFRHLHQTNIAFVDGHVGVANRPHAGNNATPALLSLMGYPKNGFLSDDDAAYDPR